MERRGWIQPVCLAVTTPEEIKEKSSSFERFYIPGEFCRQGDVLSAAADSGRLILLERGAFLAPNDIVRAVEKISTAKANLILVEAGSSFGYSDRVLDPRSLEKLKRLNCPIALNLNALTGTEGHSYAHRPAWIEDPQFDVALVRTALAFEVQYLILPDTRDLNPEALELWHSSRKVVAP
jgi:3-deoxy-D-manno-octulosonic acid (KDO) 8-phosphate synthase